MARRWIFAVGPVMVVDFQGPADPSPSRRKDGAHPCNIGMLYYFLCR